MKGIRANLKKSNLQQSLNNESLNKRDYNTHDNNSQNYNYDYEDCNSDRNDEVFNSSQNKPLNPNITNFKNQNSTNNFHVQTLHSNNTFPTTNAYNHTVKGNISNTDFTNDYNSHMKMYNDEIKSFDRTYNQKNDNVNNTINTSNQAYNFYNLEDNNDIQFNSIKCNSPYSKLNKHLDISMNNTQINKDNEKLSTTNKDKLWVKHFDEDNLKLQNDAQDLIDQTQMLIDNMYQKKKSTIPSKNISNNANSITRVDSNPNLRFSQEEQLNRTTRGKNFNRNSKNNTNSQSKFINDKTLNYEEAIRVKSRSPSPPTQEPRGVMTKFNSSMINSETNLKNYLNLNNSVLQEKLLEKIKQVKYLERELKDKNNIIKNLHNKIDKQNNELSKLNEIISVERSSNYKVEISNLNRKIKEKDKLIDDNKNTFEKIITEFKNKINNLISYNDSYASKLHQLENYNQTVQTEMQSVQESENNLKNELVETKEKVQTEIKKNVDNQRNFKEFKTKVGLLISGILENYKTQSETSAVVKNLLEKCKAFYNKEDCMSPNKNKTYYNSIINKEDFQREDNFTFSGTIRNENNKLKDSRYTSNLAYTYNSIYNDNSKILNSDYNDENYQYA